MSPLILVCVKISITRFKIHNVADWLLSDRGRYDWTLRSRLAPVCNRCANRHCRPAAIRHSIRSRNSDHAGQEFVSMEPSCVCFKSASLQVDCSSLLERRRPKLHHHNQQVEAEAADSPAACSKRIDCGHFTAAGEVDVKNIVSKCKLTIFLDHVDTNVAFGGSRCCIFVCISSFTNIQVIFF